MKDETRVWLSYAVENLKAARLLLKESLYNPCLQNMQQSIEKALKALFSKTLVAIARLILLPS